MRSAWNELYRSPFSRAPDCTFAARSRRIRSYARSAPELSPASRPPESWRAPCRRRSTGSRLGRDAEASHAPRQVAFGDRDARRLTEAAAADENRCGAAAAARLPDPYGRVCHANMTLIDTAAKKYHECLERSDLAGRRQNTCLPGPVSTHCFIRASNLS